MTAQWIVLDSSSDTIDIDASSGDLGDGAVPCEWVSLRSLERPRSTRRTFAMRIGGTLRPLSPVR